jgi:hypothetical protein
MKKLLNLQLFAEGDTGADNTAGDEPAKDAVTDTKDDAVANKDAKKAEAKYTDADIDRIIGQKLAEWKKKEDKKVDEAKKLAAMDATQKAEYERDQLKKELDEYKRKDSLAEMTKTARKMLSDSGITIPDELLSLMVTTEAEETKAAVDGFTKAFNEAVENAVKERLRGEPPRKGSAGGVATMTKEQIMAIKDPELRQKKMLENKHLFNFRR